MRQQRRKNAQTASGSFPVFPQLFFNYLIRAEGADSIRLVNAGPFLVSAIPNLERNPGVIPISFSRPNDNEAIFTYADPLGVDEVISLATWEATMRGLNGEYFAPRQWRVNSNLPTTEVNWIIDATATGLTQMTLTLAFPVTIIGVPEWVTTGGANSISMVAGINPDIVVVGFDNNIFGGSEFLNVPQGDASCVSAAGFFLAPSVTFFL